MKNNSPIIRNSIMTVLLMSSLTAFSQSDINSFDYDRTRPDTQMEVPDTYHRAGTSMTIMVTESKIQQARLKKTKSDTLRVAKKVLVKMLVEIDSLKAQNYKKDFIINNQTAEIKEQKSKLKHYSTVKKISGVLITVTSICILMLLAK
jgi:hypothetical protein